MIFSLHINNSSRVFNWVQNKNPCLLKVTDVINIIICAIKGSGITIETEYSETTSTSLTNWGRIITENTAASDTLHHEVTDGNL
jgi:hypothetical protein